MTGLPMRLDGLADEINAEHQKAQAAARDALEHALRVGDLLLEAKARVSHARMPRLA